MLSGFGHAVEIAHCVVLIRFVDLSDLLPKLCNARWDLPFFYRYRFLNRITFS
jgi:hypothetical protein